MLTPMNVYTNAFTALRNISLTLLLLGSALALQAQEDNKNSLLWKIDGNGLEEPAYLYGTIHLGDPRVFNFNDSVMAKIEEADVFALEIAMDSLNPMSLMGMMMLPEGQTLRDIYSEEDYQLIKEAVKEQLGMGMGMIDRMKPFVVMTMLMFDVEGGGAPMNPFAGGEQGAVAVDQYLYNEAKARGKTLLGIETIEEQMKLTDIMPPEMLIQSIQQKQEGQDMTEDMIEAYTKADLEQLNILINGDSANADYTRALLQERNHVMAHRIDSLAQLQSIFVAVGAGHLPGEEGVIALLQQKGYSVEPIIAPSSHNPMQQSKESTKASGKKNEKDQLPEGLIAYSDEVAGFRAGFPCFPGEQESSIKQNKKKYNFTIAGCAKDGGLYSVIYGPRPDDNKSTTIKELLEAFISMQNASMLSVSAAADRPVEYTYRHKGGIVNGKLILDAERFYLVQASEEAPHAQAFLQSFSLLSE